MTERYVPIDPDDDQVPFDPDEEPEEEGQSIRLPLYGQVRGRRERP